MEQPKAAAENKSDLVTITFHYLKSAQFRAIHVDGAVGGLTPKGLIHMAIFSERTPIPTGVTHKVSPEGRLGDQLEMIQRDGLIREVEADLLMDVRTAEALCDWLKLHIESVKSMNKDS